MEDLQQVLRKLKRLIGLDKTPLPYSVTRQQIRGTPDREAHIADTYWFNGVVITCILLDSVIVGVEVDSNAGDDFEDRVVFWATDLLFAMVFISEMLARVHQQRWEYFSDPWNIFDYVCVSMSGTALVQPAEDSSQKDIVNLRVIKALKALRILRLMRVVRHIGGLKIVEGLWLLVSGLLASVKTLMWVGVMMLILIYTFAVALMTITDSDHQRLFSEWESASMYVGSVGSSMWTMIEVITFDTWSSEIFRPMVNITPSAAFILFGAIVVVTFGVLNVVLGVMVEHMRATMDNSKKHTAKKLEDTESMLIQTMGQDFRKADRDSDGQLQYKEFIKLLKSETFAFRLRLVGVQFAEAEQLFHLMDADESGAVSPEEFVAGLSKLKGPAHGKDVVRIITFAQKHCAMARKYVQQVERMSERATELQRRLDTMGRGMTAEVAFRNDTKKHAREVAERARQRAKALRTARYSDQVTYPRLGH